MFEGCGLLERGGQFEGGGLLGSGGLIGIGGSLLSQLRYRFDSLGPTQRLTWNIQVVKTYPARRARGRWLIGQSTRFFLIMV